MFRETFQFYPTPQKNLSCCEEKFVTSCFVVQLQDKATLLTAERKKRGKTTPEGLASAEQIRAFRQQASHTVRSVCVRARARVVCESE